MTAPAFAATCLDPATRRTHHHRLNPVVGLPFGRRSLDRAASFFGVPSVQTKSGEGSARPTAVVIGSGEVGSAIAVVLHRAGWAVVLCDEVDPAWLRRGMTFTNAWYIGNADLADEAAVFCASVKSIPAVLDRHRLIAATTWSWPGVAAALKPFAVVDATQGTRGAALELKSRAEADVLTVGVGPDLADDTRVDVVVRSALIADEGGRRGSIVRAARAGRFVTARRIGDRVIEGEVVGAVGTLAVTAPQSGVLRGLSARGARIREGTEIVEVDPRGDPILRFGLCDDAVAIGGEVLNALDSRRLGAVDASADQKGWLRPASLTGEPARSA